MNGYPPREPVAQPEAPRVRVALPTATPSVTYAIVGITVLVYILQLVSAGLFGDASPACARILVRGDVLEALGARINDCIRAGEWWRFLTPVLLHASIPHILFNMYALVVFGAGLERNFGHVRFLLLYLLGAFSGYVLSFLLSGGFSVGASTAIFALVGAEGVFLYQNRKLLGDQFGRAIKNVVFIVAVNLALGLTPGIDNWGHVGGLLGGLVFSWFGGPLWEVRQTPLLPGSYEVTDAREPRTVLVGAAAVLFIFGALAIFGMLLPG